MTTEQTDERERFLVRTQGGPMDGVTVVFNETPEPVWSWPLPSTLPFDETGEYVKVTESSLPPMPRNGNVMRGAQYMWRPTDG